MAVKYLLLVNMQGQTRVAKYSDHRLGGEQVRDPSHRKFFSSISSDYVCVCMSPVLSVHVDSRRYVILSLSGESRQALVQPRECVCVSGGHETKQEKREQCMQIVA